MSPIFSSVSFKSITGFAIGGGLMEKVDRDAAKATNDAARLN